MRTFNPSKFIRTVCFANLVLLVLSCQSVLAKEKVVHEGSPNKSGAASSSSDEAAAAPNEKPPVLVVGGVKNEDKACKRMPQSLRNIMYSLFNEKAANMESLKARSSLARKMAKLMGMTMAESSANPACTGDMKNRGAGYSDKEYIKDISGSGGHRISLALRRRLLNNSTVKMTVQTNFGLCQMSLDRLNNDSSDAAYDAFKADILANPNSAMVKCGTQFVYRDNDSSLKDELLRAARCTDTKVKCFGQLVTICPKLNLELGLRAPAAYFETADASPVCTEAFLSLAKIPVAAQKSPKPAQIDH